MSDALFNKSETAAQLGVSERTLDRLRREGKIGFRQVGARGHVRFTRTDIDDFLLLSHEPIKTAARSSAPKAPKPRRKAPGDLTGYKPAS